MKTSKFNFKFITSLILTLFIGISINAQTLIQVGTGTGAPFVGSNPAGANVVSPYGVTGSGCSGGGKKVQMIYTAAMINTAMVAAGFSPGAAFIHNWGFNVTSNISASNFTLSGYTVRMANVAQADISSGYYTGASTTVHSANFVVAGTGWKMLPDFAVPFEWDGSSNLMVEVCYTYSSCGLISTYGGAQYTDVGGNNRMGAMVGNVCATAWPGTHSPTNRLTNIRMTVSSATPCSGAPNLATAGSATVCAGGSANIGLTGLAGAANYSYLWKHSSNIGGPYTAASGVNTNSTYNTPTTLPSNPSYYICEVTCDNSGQMTASNPGTVTINNFINCYCTSGFSSAAATTVRGLTNVTLAGNTTTINQNSAANTANPSPYNLYSTPVADLTAGNIYNLSTTVGTAINVMHYVTAWIDYDQDGQFGGYTSAGVPNVNGDYGVGGSILERIYFVGPTANITSNANFTVPPNATTGETAMRLRYRYGASNQTVGACVQYTGTATGGGAGEVEDYRVMILAGCVEPTLNASGGNASSITTTGATLSWNNGDGTAGRVVVLRESSLVNADPLSGTAYTANAAFGSGQEIGTGNFVVYNGSGNSVAISGLQLNTTYHYAIYEYNTAGTCYSQSPHTGSFATANGPMTYLSSTNVQQTGTSPLASMNQPILRLEVVGGPGSSPALDLTSITFNTSGTTNTLDLTGARIFYTGASTTFNTSAQFGNDITNPSGTHNINGSQSLVPGSNYFWLVYDVSIGATVGNVMDAQITSVNVGGTQTPTVTDPAGNRVITSLMNLSCGYSFQHFTPTWTSNVGQSGTTVIASGAASIDDQRWPGQSFATDFSFEYNGAVYTNFGIHSKGFIWFGATNPSGELATPISSSLGYEGAIAPFAFDMAAHSASTTTPQVTVRYTGTAPNRVCIIEWTAMRPYNNTGGWCDLFVSSTDWNRYDFQLHLHENGGTNANRIEFVYRDMNPFCVNGNGASAQVGLRGPINSDFLNRQGSGNDAHTASSSGAANTSIISHGASNYFNGNGGMRFTPTFQIPQVSPLPTAENSCPNETVELSTTSPVAIKQWYNNNLPISGANGSDYDASESGNHLLVVSQGGCSKVSDVIDVTITSCNVCETVFGIDKIESCEPIIWIDGNLYSSNNYTATQLLEGASQDGCDSLVTLNLTIWNCIQLEVGSCGATDVQMDQVLSAVFVQNHNGYRFRITGANNGGTGWNGNTFILDRPVKNFRFSHVPGAIWGETYTVEVALGDGMGEYGPYGNACNVTLVNLPATTQLQNSQCGISNVSQTTYLFANQVSNVAGYRFRIVGANNGAQGWTGNTYILDRPSRDFRFSMVPGVIWGQTYSVEVAVLSYDNLTYSPYGTACNVTLQGTPTTALQASQCGIMNVAQNTALFANTVSGAAGYRFRVVGANDGSQGWVIDTYILDRSVRNFKFNMIPGVLQGEEYQVQVAVMDANGNYGAFGSVCTITLEGTPDFVINDENEIFFDDKTMNVVEFGASASHNPFTTDFGIQVLNANDSETINVVIYDMSGKLIASKSVNPLDIENARFGQNLASGMYMIEVRQGSNQAVIRQVKN